MKKRFLQWALAGLTLGLSFPAELSAVPMLDGLSWTAGTSNRTDVGAVVCAVTSVEVKPRWPWNELVDIDYTLHIEPTNSPVTVSLSGFDTVTRQSFALKSLSGAGADGEPVFAGTHRLTWDVGADHPQFHSEAFTVEVTATVCNGTSPPTNLYMVVDLSGSGTVSYLSAVPAGGWTSEHKTTKLVMRRIEPGSFMMGDPHSADTVRVMLSQPFYMGVFEVTQKQYERVMGADPSAYKGDLHPVETVSWRMLRGVETLYDWPVNKAVAATSFMGRIRKMIGKRFDLPTEAQWEYACRAGTASLYNNGGNEIADLAALGRYGGNGSDGNDGSAQHIAVGSYLPNAWGLYDLHGNVCEWCLDGFGPLSDNAVDPEGPAAAPTRVRRGGGFNQPAKACTSFSRAHMAATIMSSNCGFRLCCPDDETLNAASLASDPVRVDTRATFGGKVATGVERVGNHDGASVSLWDTTAVADGWRWISAGRRVTDVCVLNTSAVVHGGRLSADETWSSNQVHAVRSTVVVPDGVTLILGTDAVVKFAPGAKIATEGGGILIVDGARCADIADDSVGGDTNRDGNETSPSTTVDAWFAPPVSPDPVRLHFREQRPDQTEWTEQTIVRYYTRGQTLGYLPVPRVGATSDVVYKGWILGASGEPATPEPVDGATLVTGPMDIAPVFVLRAPTPDYEVSLDPYLSPQALSVKAGETVRFHYDLKEIDDGAFGWGDDAVYTAIVIGLVWDPSVSAYSYDLLAKVMQDVSPRSGFFDWTVPREYAGRYYMGVLPEEFLSWGLGMEELWGLEPGVLLTVLPPDTPEAAAPQILYPPEGMSYGGRADGVESSFFIKVSDASTNGTYTIEWERTESGTPLLFTPDVMPGGEMVVRIAYGEGEYTSRFRVQNAAGVWSEYRTVTVSVKPPPLVSAVVETPEGDAAGDYKEGEELAVRFKLDEAYALAPLYAFLVPMDAASSNLAVSAAFERGVAIGAQQTESSGTASIRLLDGCMAAWPLTYSIALRTADTWEAGATVRGAESQNLKLFVRNAAPIVTALDMSGSGQGTNDGALSTDGVSVANVAPAMVMTSDTGVVGTTAVMAENLLAWKVDDVASDLTNNLSVVWTTSEGVRWQFAGNDVAEGVWTNVFRSAGNKTITLTATDKDGGCSSVTLQYVVRPVGEGPGGIDAAALFEWIVSSNAVIITKYVGTNSVVSIPPMIEERPVVGIGKNAFFNCRFLETVEIPDSVTSIGNGAFWGCSTLSEIVIPADVKTIGAYAFAECLSLTNVSFEGHAPTLLGDDVFDCVPSGCTAYVKRGSIGWDVEIPGAWQGLSIAYQEGPGFGFAVQFDLGANGVRSGGGELLQYVLRGEGATAPSVRPRAGWVFDGWSRPFTDISESLTVAAKYRSAYADLQVDAITVTNTVVAGGSVDVRWLLGNRGNPAFSGLMTEKILLVSAADSNDVRLVASPTFEGAVARDGSVVRTLTIDTPLKGWEGTWHVRIQTAVEPTMPEYGANNVTTSDETLEITAAPLPNLTVDAVSGEANLVPGETAWFAFVTTNSGITTASAPWIDRVYLESPDAAVSVRIGDFRRSGNLPAADAIRERGALTVPELIPLAGAVRVKIVSDINDALVETHDGDNVAYGAETVSLATNLYLTAASATVSENASGAGVRFIVKRSGPTAEALTVSLSVSGAPASSAGVRYPASVAIPAGSVSSDFYVKPIDNPTVDGARTLTVGASAGDCRAAFLDLTILDDEIPKLTVTLDKMSVREGDGVIVATVTRERVSDQPLTVSLSGVSTGRCAYPSSVVIPAGEASVTFELAVPNNDAAQITQEMTLCASSPGYASASVSYTVEDDDVPGVTLTLTPEAVSEGAGARAVYATLMRSDANRIEQAVRVKLAASEPNQLILPNDITIPAYTMAVRFAIGVVDNAQDDGEREVTINGAIVIESCGCSGQPSNGDVIQGVVDIIDNDGPALALKAEPATMKEGLDPAGCLVLSHNSALTEDLTLRLWVDGGNEDEIAFPETVTIPAGETSVRIPIATLDDGVQDGGQLVSVYVEDESRLFAPASAWVQVSDQNLPDATVTQVETPASVTAKENVTVSFAAANTGFAAVSKAVPYALHLVEGATAHTLSSATLVKSGTLTGGIAVGGRVFETVALTAPERPGDYRAAVVLDPDGTIPELDSANNTGWSAAFAVTAAYTATAGVDKNVYLPGEPVTITGSVSRADGTPAGRVPITPYVLVNGLRRTLQATTAADGSYVAVFAPSQGEAGDYAVGACYPGVDSTVRQDVFSIIGLKRASTSNIIWDIAQGDSQTRTVTIQNCSAVPLTGLSVTFTEVPEECAIASALPEMIPANGSVTLSLTATADGLTEQVDYRAFHAHVTAREGVTLDIPLYFHAQTQRAHLRATPASVDTVMVVGQESYITLDLLNDGKGDSGAITVSLPEVSWMRVVGGGRIENLPAGRSATVTIGVAPPYGVALNTIHRATLVIGCENGQPFQLPLVLTAVSGATGGLRIDVTDTLTLTAESSPHVQGAEVRVVNPATGEEVARGVTDSDGIFVCSDLPAGKYRVQISAEQHSQKNLAVEIPPGRIARQTVFLDYLTVSYVWKVVPTEIEDRYTLTLEAEYETNVPLPAMKINVPDEIPDLAEGESYICGVEIENAGLIALVDVKVSLAGSIGEWECEQISPNIERLPAKSSQTVYLKFTNPVKSSARMLSAVQNLSSAPAPAAVTEADLAKIAPCTVGMIATARALCGEEGVDLLMRSKNIRIAGHLCDLASLLFNQIGTIFDLGGGGDAPPRRTPGGAPLEPGYNEPVEIEMPDVDCACLFTVIDRALGWVLSWANVPTWVYDVVSASTRRVKDGRVSDEDKVALLTDIKDKIAELDEKIGKLNEAIGYLNDILDVYEACRDEIGENKIAEYALKIRERMDRLISIKANLERLETLIRKVSAWWKSLSASKMRVVTSPSPDAALFTENEQAGEDAAYPEELLQLAEAFILSNSAMLEALESDGIRDIGAFLTVVAGEFEEYIKGGNALAVCSTIRFKLSQTVTMAREAFEGTLTLKNGQLSGSLSDVRLQPHITDADGRVCNELFGMTDGAVVGFAGASFLGGDLTLEAGATGQASVLFVPTQNAASEKPQIYYFGGVLSYYDSLRGERLSHELAAIPLQVNPCPYLKFDYFVQRDVYADDPFTPDVVEASMPAELALLVRNVGAGDADNVTVHSIQPEIVENDKGLAATFRLSDYSLEKTALNGATAYLGLKDVALGTIPSRTSSVAQWWLSSSIEGHFIGLAASVTHANIWGHPATSLIDPDVDVHQLVRSIVADGDTLPDFLVCDGSDLYGTPNEIYTAAGDRLPVSAVTVRRVEEGAPRQLIGAGVQLRLSLTPARFGWHYGRAAIPGIFRYTIARIVRGDGVEIPLRNVWLTDRTFRDGNTPLLEERVHLVDEIQTDAEQTYTLTLTAKPSDVPEVAGFEGVLGGGVEDAVRDAVTVVFSKPIDPTTFTTDDLTLMKQGTFLDDLSPLTIRPADASGTRFTIGNLAALCSGYGRYELTVQCAGIADQGGQLGNAGKAVAWTSAAAEAPYVIGVDGVPAHRVRTLDALTVTFSAPIKPETFTAAALRINGAAVGEGVAIEALDASGTRFTVSGLSAMQAADGDYALTFDATSVAGLDETPGVGTYTVTWTRDTIAPVLLSLTRMDGGGDAFILTFSEEVVPGSLTPNGATLTRNGSVVSLSGLASLSRDGDKAFCRYVLSGIDSAATEDGTYELTFSAAGVADEAGNAASGARSVAWTVDRTPPARMTDLDISPDGGFSATDGLTSTAALTVSGILPEADLKVEILARYAGGGETVLATLPTAGEDPLPAGAFSQDIVMPGTGNATVIVRLTDAAGNVSESEKRVSVDGVALTCALTGASDDEGVVTTAATLVFSARPMEADVTLDKFVLTRDGGTVALDGVAFARVDETTFTLTGLDRLCADDGVYVLTFDGAEVRKYTSGLKMSGTAVMRWRYEHPDREPPTVTEVLFDGETPHEAYTNVFSSVSVAFSEDVNVPDLIENGLIGIAARIDLLDAAGVVTGCVAAVQNNGGAERYVWNAQTRTLSWRIDPLNVPAGGGRLVVDAALVVDPAGNRLAPAPRQSAVAGAKSYEAVAFMDNAAYSYACPTLHDWNGDGLPDVIVGEKTADGKGKVRIYPNRGTSTSPVFDSWTYLQKAGSDVALPAQGCVGLQVSFGNIDGGSLVLAASQGEIYGWNLHSPASADFVRWFDHSTDSRFAGLIRTQTFCCDVDGDGVDEVLVSGQNSPMFWLKRTVSAHGPVTECTPLVDTDGVPLRFPEGQSHTSAVMADLNSDAALDLVTGDSSGNVWVYFGVSGARFSSKPLMIYRNTQSELSRSRLAIGDLNGDGVDDLLVGRSDGSLVLLRASAVFSPAVPFSVKAVVAAAAGANGTITPAGEVTYDGGETPEYVLTPAVGYRVADVQIDGRSIGAPETYVFAPLTASHTIQATFAAMAYPITYTGLKGAAHPNPAAYTVESSITFAAPDDIYGWVFKGWSPAFIAPGRTGPLEVTAEWEREKFGVTVNGETRTFSYEDSVVFATNAVLTCGATQYVCKGWAATNADPGSGDGAHAAFRVLGDVSFDWLWETNIVTLAQAVDAQNLVWTSGGAALWTPAWSTAANDGLHHAHSGAVGDNMNSWIETSIVGPGTLSFAWRSSTETRYDMCQLIVDGDVKGSISGETLWTTNTLVLSRGQHTVRWNYRKSRSGATGQDRVWLDSVTWTADVPPTLAEALNPELYWKTQGDVAWSAVRKDSLLETRDDWATVAALADYESSAIETAVYGAGVLTFEWSVSCEDGYDWFDFAADGEIRASVTGESEWKTVTIEFKAGGRHTLRWEYWKDDLDDPALAGGNRASLDNVRWTPLSEASQHTATTPQPVPYATLRSIYRKYWLAAEGDYERAAHSTGCNGVSIWESYVAGLNPEEEESRFMSMIEMVDGKPVVTWQPDNETLRKTRRYKVYGKKDIGDEREPWSLVREGEDGRYRFFKVTVELPSADDQQVR